MISRPLTRVVNSAEMNVAPGAVILAEGQALVRANGNLPAGVLPATGTATDVFVGFAFAGTSAYPFPEQYTNKVESFIAPAAGNTITLSQTPIANQVFILDTTNGTPLVAGTDFTVAGNVVTLAGTKFKAGDTLAVTYKYSMTVVQAAALMGNTQPGGYAGAYVGQIGVVTRGVVYTSEFDASASWATATKNTGGALAATDIVLGANGQLTLHGTTAGANGVAFPGVVIAVPGESYPFLGVDFSAAV